MSSPTWIVPRLWPDRTVFVIGGGPSIADTPLDLIHDYRSIGVNYAFALGDWVDVCWFGDARFHRKHRKELLAFPGLIATCCPALYRKGERGVQVPPAGVRVIRKSPSRVIGIDSDPRFVCWNKNSGASAINLAVHFGASRIILLGFDMRQSVDGRNNYHSAHDSNPPATVYERRFLPVFPRIRADLDALGVECLNATPGTQLHEFPKVDLREWIEGERAKGTL